MSDKLVAYFSASGVTTSVAKKLAESIESPLFEIEPKEKYTNEDLDWTDKSSRSSIEMNDESSRPKINNKVENMEKYNTIFVGFPIWWYKAPRIINTFLENYNLNGKTIIPFATSGSSDIDNICEDLKKSASGAVVLKGKRFSASVSTDELKAWAKNY